MVQGFPEAIKINLDGWSHLQALDHEHICISTITYVTHMGTLLKFSPRNKKNSPHILNWKNSQNPKGRQLVSKHSRISQSKGADSRNPHNHSTNNFVVFGLIANVEQNDRLKDSTL